MRLIDAHEVLRNYRDLYERGIIGISYWNIVKEITSEQFSPTVDAGIIVRCKDCIMGEKTRASIDGKKLVLCSIMNEKHPENFYCSLGCKR